MNKLKSLFLALTVAMLTGISAYADQGTPYFQGYAAFDWKTTYIEVGNGVYEHFLTVTQRCTGSVTLYGVSCNNSPADGNMSLHGSGQTHSTHFTDRTYAQQWHWTFHIERPSYSL
jgi:pectin methylesterase-like acyl-CoA thioesterase